MGRSPKDQPYKGWPEPPSAETPVNGRVDRMGADMPHANLNLLERRRASVLVIQGHLYRRLLACRSRDYDAGRMPAVRVHDKSAMQC